MKTNDLVKIALFPALMAATAGISIPMVGAPITLQTMFVLMAGLMLGKRNAAISMVVYLLLGAFGLPVFSGFSGGVASIVGPTGGFLLSFPLAAFLAGCLKEHMKNQYVVALLASVLIYLIGVPWLAVQLGMSIGAAFSMMLVYIPGDIIKLIVAVVIAKRVEVGM